MSSNRKFGKLEIGPKPGFDWRRVAWGAPKSPMRDLCAYCHGKLGDDADPTLMLFKEDGSRAEFCDRCVERWWS